MLHATARAKSRLYQRYLGKRDEDERRVHEEDEITSTIFGPLDFMQTEEVEQFWRQLLKSVGQASFLPDQRPRQITMTLWDRRGIEPDMVIRFDWPDNTYTILLVELKWRAPLSGDKQLHRQWQEYLSDAERKNALHLFIAPETSSAYAAMNNTEAGGNVWAESAPSTQTDTALGRLIPIPWIRIRLTLAELAAQPTSRGKWASAADRFLDKIGIQRFSGFTQLGSPRIQFTEGATLIMAHSEEAWSFRGLLPLANHPVIQPCIPNKAVFWDVSRS
jgi:hypothetical protein